MSDKLSKEKQKQKNKMARGFLFRTLILMAVCGVGSFTILAFRLYDVQITSNVHYERLALQSQLRHATLSASRGTIFDANGKILAMSAAVENVFISPFDIQRFEEDAALIADGLSTILGVSRESILERAGRTDSQYMLIKRNLSIDETEQVREFILRHGLRSIHFEPSSKRFYPNNTLAGQIIGFVGIDNNGLEGLERQFDGYLTGVNGREVRITNARGASLNFADFEDYYAATDGNNITLTIDAQIQYFVEKHLERAIEDYDVQNGGVAIAIRPNTGEILAIASYPNFDPNNFMALGEREAERISHIEDEEELAEAVRAAQFRQWRNRALTDTYEPGSVFKIMTMAMVLEDNEATLDSHFHCEGSMRVLGRVRVDENGEAIPIPLQCWSRYGHGQQTLSEAMQNSCNVAFVNIGIQLGARRFYEHIGAFGLFDRTGLNISAESRSLWWDERIFFDRDNHSQLASASFGQTFKVTPIQMITAAAATINGGYLMQPYIVKHITDSVGNILVANEPTVLRQTVSANTSAMIRSELENVVQYGTGRNAQARGYRIGGKTGTSENVEQISAESEGAPKNYIVSFIGFAPADDPEIMILVLLDTPSHDTGIQISGGAMAAPVVGNMMADILPMCLGVRPQYTEEDLKYINVSVLGLTSRSVEEAIEHLTSQGFEYRVVGDGANVTAQLPQQNLLVSSGTTVILYAGEEPPREMVDVPQLFRVSFESAKEALESSGLFIRAIGVPKSDPRAEISVQSIPAGTQAPVGAIIEVTLINRDAVAPN